MQSMFTKAALALALISGSMAAYAKESEGAVIQMCAQGQETVAPDLANLNFSLVVKNADKTEAANKANKMQRDASTYIKSLDADAKIVNQNYQTYQTVDKNNKPNGWQVSQNFVVKTKHLTELDKMTAKTQELGMVFSGVNYSVTNEFIDSLQDSLYKKAFANLQKRMDVITDGVRAKKWEVVSLDLMSNRPCNEAALQAAQVAVKEYGGGDLYGRAEKLGYSTAPVASDGLMREAKIAAPTFDAADQTLKLNLWVSARIK